MSARADFSRRWALVLMTCLLLLVMVTRTPGLATLQLDPDEVWSVWQSVDGPAAVIARTPYDWTPTYFLLMGGWTSLASNHPLAVRLFALLTFMLAVPFAYQAGRQLGGRKTGLVLAFAFAALSYQLFISTYPRGSAAASALLPVILWSSLRFLDRPGLRRAMFVVASTAAILYIYLNALVALAFLALFLWVLYGRRVLRLWKPALVALVLALPVLLPRVQLAIARTNATQARSQDTLLADFAGFFGGVFGQSWPLWLGLLAILFILGIVAARARAFNRVLLAAAVWFVSGPIILYVSDRWLGFFSPHYAWWIATTCAVLLAAAARVLRPAWVLAALAAMGALMFVPYDRSLHTIETPPVADAFEWLQTRLQPGDVLVIDPNCACAPPEVWDYYRGVYFPRGLAQTSDPGGERRIWYLATAGHQDSQLMRRVEETRLAGEYIGPWDFLLRLYEGPPDRAGITFENGLRFHGAEIVSNRGQGIETGIIVRREGEPVTVRLWWSASRRLERDYSVGLYVLYGDTQTIVEANGPPEPLGGNAQTSTWEPGMLFVEERTLTLPFGLWTGEFKLALSTYYWEQPTPSPAEGYPDGLIPAGVFQVMAW